MDVEQTLELHIFSPCYLTDSAGADLELDIHLNLVIVKKTNKRNYLLKTWTIQGHAVY